MATGAEDPELDPGEYRHGDERRVSELIGRMSENRPGLHLRDKSPAYYWWMYEQNPCGRAIVRSVRRGDELVASFALAPKAFAIDGERTVVGKTMDMFTDPAWQGRGLMSRCTDAVFEAAAASGIPGWYVTPSVNSYPIFVDRWGYREHFSLTYRLAVVTPGWLPGRRALPAGYELADVATFDDAADDLWERVSGEYQVAQERDAAYLNWRYVANPDRYDLLALRRQGRVVGLVVLGWTVRRGIRVGELMELIHDPADEGALRLLVRSAARRARERRCWLLQAWSLPGTRLDGRLRTAGLRWRRGEVKFLLSPGFPGVAAADPDAWLLSQGDGNDV